METTDELLARVHRNIRIQGPMLVMVSAKRAVRPEEAAAIGVTPDIIYIRNDYWSLGAPANLAADARLTWPLHWLAVTRAPFAILEQP